MGQVMAQRKWFSWIQEAGSKELENKLFILSEELVTYYSIHYDNQDD